MAADRHHRGRRRSPASTARIVTVGASTTAVLGMMAGYGIADQAASGKPILLADGKAIAAPPLADAGTPIVPAAAPPTDAPQTVPPQVIVVVIDGATGQQVSGDLDLSTLAAAPPDAATATADGTPVVPSTQAAPATPSSPASPEPAASPAPSAHTATPATVAAQAEVPAPAPAAAPAPVAAPIAVDLAVPAAPPPPAPAPAPQATSSGS
jgi:hypothetical protein